MAYTQLDPGNLTPGVLDGYAKRAFKYGACGALALALHDAKGWPIVAVTDAHNVHDGQAGGGSSLHYMVRHPSGQLLDVDGFHEDADVLEEYMGEADDEQAALGISTRQDVWEWYGEAQGEPIPLDLAGSFVNAVITNASLAGAHTLASFSYGVEGDARDTARRTVEHNNGRDDKPRPLDWDHREITTSGGEQWTAAWVFQVATGHVVVCWWSKTTEGKS